MPVLVRWSHSQRATPTVTPRASMASRVREYCTPARCRSILRSIHPGQVMRGKVAAAGLERAGAREVGDDLVGDDDRDGDRDQGLTQILPLIPAEKPLLDEESEPTDADHRHRHRDQPFPRVDELSRDEARRLRGHPLLNLVRDVAAQEVEDAVGHVHDAHEPEDEREAAGDDEEPAGKGHRVEQVRDQRAGVVDRRPVVGRSPTARAALRGRVGNDEHEEEREDDEPGRGGARHGSYDSPGANSFGHRPGERTNVARRFQRQPLDVAPS